LRSQLHPRNRFPSSPRWPCCPCDAASPADAKPRASPPRSQRIVRSVAVPLLVRRGIEGSSPRSGLSRRSYPRTATASWCCSPAGRGGPEVRCGVRPDAHCGPATGRD
jgi:hypothetical protein